MQLINEKFTVRRTAVNVSEAKIKEINFVPILTCSENEIARLDITMNETK